MPFAVWPHLVFPLFLLRKLVDVSLPEPVSVLSWSQEVPVVANDCGVIVEVHIRENLVHGLPPVLRIGLKCQHGVAVLMVEVADALSYACGGVLSGGYRIGPNSR